MPNMKVYCASTTQRLSELQLPKGQAKLERMESNGVTVMIHGQLSTFWTVFTEKRDNYLRCKKGPLSVRALGGHLVRPCLCPDLSAASSVIEEN
ncbi:hypothetical protein Y1Q_0006229 [Alligator mississippiensis]|uniref:Uncharacterized protein n=1 Tax=Alligator mississippiensis TaxID=8496 RepID=A0A151NXK6_ALLMI|nr:hypothetical protein Y1Q_0006229 [Alligator mississippiensis]